MPDCNETEKTLILVAPIGEGPCQVSEVLRDEQALVHSDAGDCAAILEMHILQQLRLLP